MATPTSYLQTLTKGEAIAFVASLQKVKIYLSQEFQWMTQAVQQKTIQFQGIETLLSEAAALGLLSPNAAPPTNLTSGAEASTSTTGTGILNVDDFVNGLDDLKHSADFNGDALLNHDPDVDNSNIGSPATTAEPTAASTKQKQSNGRKKNPDSKPTREAKLVTTSTSAAPKAKKTNRSINETGKGSSSNSAVDLRELLATKFRGRTFTDLVAQILASAREPLHLNDMVDEMYDNLSDQDFKRAKGSLAKVLSVGKSEGKWQNLGQGMYVANAGVTT